jgi:hypothetical protein
MDKGEYKMRDFLRLCGVCFSFLCVFLSIYGILKEVNYTIYPSWVFLGMSFICYGLAESFESKK